LKKTDNNYTAIIHNRIKYHYNNGVWQKNFCANTDFKEGKAYISFLNRKKIITTDCRTLDGSKSDEENLYVYADDYSKVIRCKNSSQCSVSVPDIGCYIIGKNGMMCWFDEEGKNRYIYESNDTRYYFNNGGDKKTKPLIECIRGKCQDIAPSPGYYVNSVNTNLVYCKTNTTCTESARNTSSTPKYYYNAGDDKKFKPLIKCDKNGCGSVKTSLGHYVNSDNNNLIYCESASVCKDDIQDATTNIIYYLNNGDDKDSNSLIKCTKGRCSTSKAFVGYFLNGSYTSLIYCESTTTCYEVSNNKSSYSNYYLNSGHDMSLKPLIKCNSSGCSSIISTIGYYFNSHNNSLIYCESNKVCKEGDINTTTTSKYYLNNGDNNTLYPLIECSNSVCETKTATVGGYVDSDTNHLIYCANSSTCNKGEVNTTTIGKFYLNSGADKRTKPLVKCVKTGCSTLTASIGYYINSANSNVIYCRMKNSCKDINEGRESIYYLSNEDDRNSKPLIKCVNGQCVTTKASIGYFVIGVNTAIYCKSATSCSEVNENTSIVPKYYLNSGNDKKLKPLIKCVKKGCETMMAKKGYYVNHQNNKLINCGTATSCSEITKDYSIEYYINNGDDTNSEVLIKCNSSGCFTTKASAGYYIDSSINNLIYCEDNTYCKKMGKNTSTVSKYYLNNGDDSNAKPLIDCVNSTCTTITASIGYYADGANYLVYCEKEHLCSRKGKNGSSIAKYYLNVGGDKDTKPFIKCDKDGCFTITATVGYYIDGENNLIYCESSSDCKKTSMNTSSIAEYYTDNGSERDPKSLIKCVNGGCRVASSVGYYLDNENRLFYCKSINDCNEVAKNTSYFHVFYINNGDDLELKPIISCAEGECETIPGVIGGYFTDSNKNLIYCESETLCYEIPKNTSSVPYYYINNNDDKDNKPLIKCVEGKCVTEKASKGYLIDGQGIWLIHCSSSEVCNEVSKNTSLVSKYYLNNGVDKNTNPLIRCADSSCETIIGFKGFYINSDNINLIYCESNTVCMEGEINTTYDSKYYINNGDDKNLKQIIKCVNSKCQTMEALMGYYVNSGNNNLIYCETKTDCREGDINTTSISKYYFNNGDDSHYNPLIRCISSSCTTTDASIGGYVNSANNNVIYCTNSSNCYEISANTSAAPMYYANRGDGTNVNAVISCSSGSCGTIAASIGAYVNGLNNSVIYCETTKSCIEVGLNTSSTPKYYKNNGHDASINQLITCVSSSCQTTDASIGGYINGINNSVIYCKSYDSCSEISLNTTSAPMYYINNGYDKASKAIISCASSNCQSMAAASGAYVNGINNSVIYCASASSCSEIGLNTSSTPKYYKNNGQDKSSKAIISCASSKCQTIAAAVGGYINGINSSVIYCASTSSCSEVSPNTSTTPKYYKNNGHDKGSKPLLSCASNKCQSLSASIGGYINGTNTNVVYCSSATSCNETSKNTSSNPLYYINNGHDSNSKALIQCASSSCTSMAASVGGYVNGGNNKLIRCVSGSQCEEYNSISGTKYYTNSGNNKSSNPLIKCTSSSCVTTTASSGYYLNVASGLIYCSSSSSCSVNSGNTSPSDRYYINNGGDSALIKCNSGNCSGVSRGSCVGYLSGTADEDVIFCADGGDCSVYKSTSGSLPVYFRANMSRIFIKCENTNGKTSCSTFEPSQSAVYRVKCTPTQNREYNCELKGGGFVAIFDHGLV